MRNKITTDKATHNCTEGKGHKIPLNEKNFSSQGTLKCLILQVVFQYDRH
jgi:hypothetical protein